MKTRTKIALAIMIFITVAHAMMFAAWQWRNPKANQMTFYTHYVDMMTFKKVPEFQK